MSRLIFWPGLKILHGHDPISCSFPMLVHESLYLGESQLGVYCQFGALLSSVLLGTDWEFCWLILHLSGVYSPHLLSSRLRFLSHSYRFEIACSIHKFTCSSIVFLALFYILFLFSVHSLLKLVVFFCDFSILDYFVVCENLCPIILYSMSF